MQARVVVDHVVLDVVIQVVAQVPAVQHELAGSRMLGIPEVHGNMPQVRHDQLADMLGPGALRRPHALLDHAQRVFGVRHGVCANSCTSSGPSLNHHPSLSAE